MYATVNNDTHTCTLEELVQWIDWQCSAFFCGGVLYRWVDDEGRFIARTAASAARSKICTL